MKVKIKDNNPYLYFSPSIPTVLSCYDRKTAWSLNMFTNNIRPPFWIACSRNQVSGSTSLPGSLVYQVSTSCMLALNVPRYQENMITGFHGRFWDGLCRKQECQPKSRDIWRQQRNCVINKRRQFGDILCRHTRSTTPLWCFYNSANFEALDRNDTKG